MKDVEKTTEEKVELKVRNDQLIAEKVELKNRNEELVMEKIELKARDQCHITFYGRILRMFVIR
jgi:hypothetical protein